MCVCVCVREQIRSTRFEVFTEAGPEQPTVYEHMLAGSAECDWIAFVWELAYVQLELLHRRGAAVATRRNTSNR